MKLIHKVTIFTNICSVLLFSGCSCTGGTLCPNSYPKEPESMYILKMQSLDQNKTKVYVDNSLDRAKNRLFIETFSEAINTHGVWEDVYVSESSFIKKDMEFYTINHPMFNNKIQEEIVPNYIAKITMDHYALSGNYVFKKYISYSNSGIVKTSTKYPAHKYTSVILDDKRLEIKGFESEKEAVDLFLYIVDSTIKFGFDEDFTKTIESTFKAKGLEFLDPTKYYGGMALEFDPIALDKENRLIIKSVLDYYSLKLPLQNELIGNVQVVDNAKEADLIIVVNNLAYTSLATTKQTNLEKVQTEDMSMLLNKGYGLNDAGMALNTLSSNNLGSAQARGATGAIAGTELALGLIGAFSGPNKTQNRFDLQKVYFLKPTGEVITAKIYSDSTMFTDAGLQADYFHLATLSNTKISKQILFDLQ